VTRVVGKRLTVVPLPPTAGSPGRRQPDMSTTAAVTGFRAAVGLEEGVRRTFLWYRDHVFGEAGA
jgi:nucleoside-diphosphate-sugar epimerase